MRGLVITGTDTEAGKTFVAGLLLSYLQQQGLNPGYVKLVSCGGRTAPDINYCRQQAGLPADLCQAAYHFSLPASPHLAAGRENIIIEEEKLCATVKAMAKNCRFLVAEGAGGLLVPLRPDLLLADFLPRLGLPLLIVARSGLGTINHTLLTIEAAQKRNLAILGVIFSDEKKYSPDELIPADNARIIEKISGVPVLGRLPRGQSQAAEAFAAAGKKLLAALGLQEQARP